MSTIRKLFCPTCLNIRKLTIVDEDLHKYCEQCQESEKCDPDEYLINVMWHEGQEPNMVNVPSIVDDPCLPKALLFCSKCNKMVVSKYIRSDYSLKITHHICTKCREIVQVQ